MHTHPNVVRTESGVAQSQPTITEFISDIETKLSLIPGNDTTSLSHRINFTSRPTAEIAPWSSVNNAIIEIEVAVFNTREQAVAHFDRTMKDLLPEIAVLDVSWSSPDISGQCAIVWAKAPHPAWHGFMKRRITRTGDERWMYTMTMHLYTAFAVVSGLEDLRLVDAPDAAIMPQSYTFGIACRQLDFTHTESESVLAKWLRDADVHRVCERLSVVCNDDFGASCAVTLSRIMTKSHTYYTLEDALGDIQQLIDAVNAQLTPQQKCLDFSKKPVVNLAAASDLSKELILGLAGGKQIMGVTLKRFVDRATVCTKLRELETQDDFWTAYEHEFIDKTTGKKRYEFYGVYRPRIGYPFNRTYLEPPESEEWKTYFDSSRAVGEYLRQMLRPYEYPIDRFLNMLDNLLDTNIHIHPKYDAKMQAGMLRLMPNNAMTGIHIDHPPDAQLGDFRNILSTNFYTARSSLQKGGELYLWDAPLLRYGSDLTNVKRDYISLHVSPEEGDAIMLCPELPHAIGRVVEGNRLSLNVFLGLFAAHDALRVWN